MFSSVPPLFLLLRHLQYLFTKLIVCILLLGVSRSAEATCMTEDNEVMTADFWIHRAAPPARLPSNVARRRVARPVGAGRPAGPPSRRHLGEAKGKGVINMGIARHWAVLAGDSEVRRARRGRRGAEDPATRCNIVPWIDGSVHDRDDVGTGRTGGSPDRQVCSRRRLLSLSKIQDPSVPPCLQAEIRPGRPQPRREAHVHVVATRPACLCPRFQQRRFLRARALVLPEPV